MEEVIDTRYAEIEQSGDDWLVWLTDKDGSVQCETCESEKLASALADAFLNQDDLLDQLGPEGRVRALLS